MTTPKRWLRKPSIFLSPGSQLDGFLWGPDMLLHGNLKAGLSWIPKLASDSYVQGPSAWCPSASLSLRGAVSTWLELPTAGRWQHVTDESGLPKALSRAAWLLRPLPRLSTGLCHIALVSTAPGPHKLKEVEKQIHLRMGLSKQHCSRAYGVGDIAATFRKSTC